MKYKTALLIGRFQPFHLGHLYLIKKALVVAEKVVVGIGSANIYDSNNPLDWKTREKILKSVFYKEDIDFKVSKIVPLDDFFNDEKWLNNVRDKAGNFEIVVGNNQWVNGIMEKGGYKVLRVPYYKRYMYEGEKIRKLLVTGGNWQERVPVYLIKFIREQLTANLENVVLGGTFDHFHKGHRAMLDKAFTVGKKITVGIAAEELYKDKFLSNKIERFSIRKKSVRDYLASKNWTSRAKLISFNNFKGPLDTKKNVDAIIVSRQTLPNALKINRLRVENKLPQLKTVVIGDVVAADGRLISSDRIRRGEIDREGTVYSKVFANDLKMPESMREELRKPLGRVIRGSLENKKKTAKKAISLIKKIKPTLTIAVGDIIAHSLASEGFVPDINIIDQKSRRESLTVSGSKKAAARNMPGTIANQSVVAIGEAIKALLLDKKPAEVVVEGEEDLLTLPAILLAPLGSLVLYGHWQLGVIMVPVTEENKNKIMGIVARFSKG